MTVVLIRRVEDTDTHTQGRRSEDWSHVAKSQEMPGHLEAQKGKEGFFPRTFGRSMALLTP